MTLREDIVRWLNDTPAGLTAKELANRIDGADRQGVTAALTKLKEGGAVRKLPEKRRADGDRLAFAWVVAGRKNLPILTPAGKRTPVTIDQAPPSAEPSSILFGRYSDGSVHVEAEGESLRLEPAEAIQLRDFLIWNCNGAGRHGPGRK